MEHSVYLSHMHHGQQYLNSGQLHAAVIQYEKAAAYAGSPVDEAQATQMLGVVLRVGGDLVSSRESLTKALKLAAGSPLLHATIGRDLAMTLMEELRPGDQERFDRIAELLEESEHVFPKTMPDHWASEGFLGRAEFLFGNRREGHAIMAVVDREFRQLSVAHPTYELNNLIWLMRSGSARERLVHLPRALSLARETGQTRRYKELAVIVIGGNRLYKLAREAFKK